ncbi:MAG: nitroreductase family deazaflavin-dependent oxidoreductase [Acidimicrobiia bacterium]|nr:nitroreductase family deazaflavin-dependent oxidoreductase [Acidimicrobiia bacterium]
MKPKNAVRLDRTLGPWLVYPLHGWVYRVTDGRVGHRSGVGPILLLSTTGRRTGETRVKPLLYMPHGDSFVVAASNAGRDKPPDWSLNLQAEPSATVQVGREKAPVRARFVRRSEDPHLWALLDGHYAGFSHYQTLTDREILAVVLERDDAEAGNDRS